MPIRITSLVVLSCVLAPSLRAQANSTSDAPAARGEAARAEAPTGGRKASNKRAWHTSSVVEITSEYDDNIYLLRDGARADLARPSASEVVSGRFVDMNSASGAIGTVGLAAAFRGPGLGGRALELRPELSYTADALNTARRAVGVGFGVVQRVQRGGSLRLSAQLTPSWFGRNYMVDAVDVNGDGAIASAERVFAAGTYRDAEVAMAYRHRLDKSTKKHPFGAALQVGGGYYARTYEQPFAGRDMNGPTADVRLLLDVTRRVGMDVSYGFASLAATPTPQVLVVDEGDAGRDLNGNGATDDLDVRVAALTDRSRTAHQLGVRASFELSKRSSLRVDVDRRIRAFSSSEPLDFANNGRRDTRDRLGAQLSVGVGPRTALLLRGEHAVQRLQRDLAAGAGEIDDFTRNRLSLGLRFGR